MAMESSVLLDEIGRKLLAALQEDARLSYAELGRRIGLSPAATAERLRRLEGVGIVTGYRVEIDREALGLPVLAIRRRQCSGAQARRSGWEVWRKWESSPGTGWRSTARRSGYRCWRLCA